MLMASETAVVQAEKLAQGALCCSSAAHDCMFAAELAEIDEEW